MSEFGFDSGFDVPLEEEDLKRELAYDDYSSAPVGTAPMPQEGAVSPADEAKKKVVEDYLKQKKEKAAKEEYDPEKSGLLKGYEEASSEDDIKAAKERKRQMDMFAAAGEGALALFGKRHAKVPYVQHWKDTSAPKFADPGSGVSIDMAAISKDGQADVDAAKAKRKEAIEAYLMKDKLSQEDKTRFRADSKERALKDPNSNESVMARELAKKYNPKINVDGMTAEELGPMLPYLEKQYQIDMQRQIRSESAAQREQDRNDKKTEKDEQRKEELEIPGYGRARSKEEAKDLRTAVVDTKSALNDLRGVKALGKNIAVWDLKNIGKLNQLLDVAVGKLRLSMVGPGAMTDKERENIRNAIGDPSKLFSTEDIQNGKLDQLIESIERRLQDEIDQKVIKDDAIAAKEPPPAGGKPGSKPSWAK